MKQNTIIGVMGPGNPDPADKENAYCLGKLIAANGWILLNGGRNCGVMDASARGAKENGGLTVGILPDEDKNRMSDYIDIPVLTGMGSARNNINVLSSDIIVACGISAGTASEIALALKAGKTVIFLQKESLKCYEFFRSVSEGRIERADSPEEAVAVIRKVLQLQ
ncbi:MAG: TIGR00725 family protein [Bacteroidetes bacterium]|nr:TIGR00725 family protein [Bacteroidota bacterium]